MEHDAVTQKQLKNIKRKLVAHIWEAPAKRAIEVCLMLGISIPKNLINKFASKDFDNKS